MRIDDHTEWLEADGLGGFASGTTSGVRTRRYHALLLVATTPPTGRVVLVNGFDAWIDTSAGSFALSSQRYAPDVLYPDGATHITGFSDDPWPTWEYQMPDGTRLTQEFFVQHRTSAVVVVWTLVRATGPVGLRARPFLSGRDYHSMHHQNGAFHFDADHRDAVVVFRLHDGLPAVTSLSNGDYRARARLVPAVSLPGGSNLLKAEQRRALEFAISQIVNGYARGTRFGILMDGDGLLSAGVPGVQLTWMDARVGERVITPRIGKPVEIQALWLNALSAVSRLEPSWCDVFERGRTAFLEFLERYHRERNPKGFENGWIEGPLWNMSAAFAGVSVVAGCSAMTGVRRNDEPGSIRRLGPLTGHYGVKSAFIRQLRSVEGERSSPRGDRFACRSACAQSLWKRQKRRCQSGQPQCIPLSSASRESRRLPETCRHQERRIPSTYWPGDERTV